GRQLGEADSDLDLDVLRHGALGGLAAEAHAQADRLDVEPDLARRACDLGAQRAACALDLLRAVGAADRARPFALHRAPPPEQPGLAGSRLISNVNFPIHFVQ